MIQHHECGAEFWVEYREDGQCLKPVYYYDDKEVTHCPNCGAPLPTELLRPDPDDDDPVLWDNTCSPPQSRPLPRSAGPIAARTTTSRPAAVPEDAP